MNLKKIIYFFLLGFAISVNCYALKPNNSISDNSSKKDGDNKEFIRTKGCKRLLSYNIKHCEGMDNVVNYDRTASVIRSLNPDVVCLQELDSMNTRCNVFQMEVLGEKLDMHSYFGSAIPYKGSKYGLGVLSKEKAINVYNFTLPGVVNHTFLLLEFHKYIVICVHLDLTEVHRVESVKIITEQARKFKKPVYLAGDFNEDNLKGKMFSEFYKDWDIISLTNNTFPTGNPIKCIDYVLEFKGVNYNNKIKNKNVVYALKDVDVSNTSDHYPIFIDFK